MIRDFSPFSEPQISLHNMKLRRFPFKKIMLSHLYLNVYFTIIFVCHIHWIRIFLFSPYVFRCCCCCCCCCFFVGTKQNIKQIVLQKTHKSHLQASGAIIQLLLLGYFIFNIFLCSECLSIQKYREWIRDTDRFP